MSNRFIYFGTPYVARDTLAVLVENGHVPALVVTTPDAPSGRGQQVLPCETKAWAEEHNLPVLSPEKLDAKVLEELSKVGAEYAVVVAYGKILPQKLLHLFPKGVLNIHYSLLPKYRGASPVESALLQGETVTGVSIQKMVYELDAGDVLVQKEVAIEPTETTRELRRRLVDIGAEMLVEVLPSFIDGTAKATSQNTNEVTHFGKILKEEGLLSLTDDALQNWNKYRAYAESPGTYFFIEKNGKKMRIKIKTARFENGQFIPERVVPEGKKETNFADFTK